MTSLDLLTAHGDSLEKAIIKKGPIPKSGDRMYGASLT